MVELTTKRGVRILCPQTSLIQRMLTNSRMIWYKRLLCNVFPDKLISGNSSKRGNNYAEVFAKDFGWARVNPMKTKGNIN